MRKLIFAISVTLDGCCDHTKFNPDKEALDYFTGLTQSADTFLYGRKTHELMVPYWPDVANNPLAVGNIDYEFAQAFNAINNIIVFSRSLKRFDGHKTKIFQFNLFDEVLKLKQKLGKNILTGGVEIPTQLAEYGLIDEYHLLVYPNIAGAGKRLFESVNLHKRLQLKLIDSIVFKSGIIALRYSK